MAAYVNDVVLDAAANYIANNANRIAVDSAASGGDYTLANTTYMLGYKAMTTGSGGGSYTVENGLVSGRRCTVEQVTSLTISNTGTAVSVALLDTVNSRVLAETPINSTAVTATNTITVAEWGVEFRDAAAA